MKKILCLTLAIVMLLSLAVPALAEQPIKVTVGGEKIKFDVQPQMINDRTMVPLRAIFEALDAEVSWDEATQVIKATKGHKIIRLAIDDNTMWVNSSKVTLDVPATLVDGRTLVPVRAISEAFGLKVDWVDATQTVKVRVPVSLPVEIGTSGFETYVEKITYDMEGNATYIESSDGFWAKHTYDESDNLTYIEFPDEAWQKLTYDENDNLIYSETSDETWEKYTYDENGNEVYMETSGGQWTKSTYDEKGNKTYYETSDGWWEKYTYDENGNVIASEAPAGYKVTITYDEKGNEISSEDSKGEWSKTTYDENGNKIRSEFSDEYYQTYTYDENGNEIYMEASDGYWKKSSYDDNGNLSHTINVYGDYENYIVLEI